MARPPELNDPVKMNLFVPRETRVVARALANRARKRDAKANMSRVLDALIHREARAKKITEEELQWSRDEEK